MATEQEAVLIENWMRIGECLYGNVYDHERFPQGSFVRTSIIVMPPETRRTVLGKGDMVKTENSLYLLGSPAGRFDA